jgi:hypothetical protein
MTVNKASLGKIWALMLLLTLPDGLVTRVGLANGAMELNPWVDVSNLAFHQVLEVLAVSFLIFLNALSAQRPRTVVLGVNFFRATTRANRIVVWILFIVVSWNLVNILLDMVLT